MLRQRQIQDGDERHGGGRHDEHRQPPAVIRSHRADSIRENGVDARSAEYGDGKAEDDQRPIRPSKPVTGG